MNSKRRSFGITIGAISCALSLIALVGAIYLPTAKLTMLVLSAIFLSLPMTVGLLWPSTIAFFIVCLLGFLIGNIKALIYVSFGGYVLLQWCIIALKNKAKYNKYIMWVVEWIIKIGVYFALFYFNYLILGITINTQQIDIPVIAVAFIGVVPFIIYDCASIYLFRHLIIPMSNKIPYIKRYRDEQNSIKNKTSYNDGNDIFE